MKKEHVYELRLSPQRRTPFPAALFGISIRFSELPQGGLKTPTQPSHGTWHLKIARSGPPSKSAADAPGHQLSWNSATVHASRAHQFTWKCTVNQRVLFRRSRSRRYAFTGNSSPRGIPTSTQPDCTFSPVAGIRARSHPHP